VVAEKRPKKKKLEEAKKFLKKDHHDSNMLVAIRIRPLSQKEYQGNEFSIVKAEDKLLVHSFLT
jgi:hypothetical protein